jgi:hypothetical protein
VVDFSVSPVRGDFEAELVAVPLRETDFRSLLQFNVDFEELGEWFIRSVEHMMESASPAHQSGA